MSTAEFSLSLGGVLVGADGVGADVVEFARDLRGGRYAILYDAEGAHTVLADDAAPVGENVRDSVLAAFLGTSDDWIRC